MHTLHRLCAACALALGFSGAVLAQSQGVKTQDVKNLQTLQSAAVLSISPADTQALMQNFSAVRPRFSQNGGETLYQAICQGCHMALPPQHVITTSSPSSVRLAMRTQSPSSVRR